MIRGSCLCGDLAWEVSTPFEMMSHCHCSMCRKMHGAAFATFVAAPSKGFRWLRGADGVRRYESSRGTHRGFCGRCGSVAPSDPVGESVFLPAGNLESDPGIRPQSHVFVGSKAPWHEISDAVSRFEEYPPGMGEGVPTRRKSESAAGKVRGSCLCGGVVFEVDAPIEGVIINCHCSRCRRARSAAHGSNFFVETGRFRWTRGEDQVAFYRVPEAQRFAQTFCRTCGSSLPRVDAERGRVVVPAGALDDDPGLREGAHIFVGSKAPWYEISDALPQHAEYPPGAYPPIARSGR